MSRRKNESPIQFVGGTAARSSWSTELLIPLLLMNCLVIGLALAVPDLRATWLREDEYLETVTAAAYGLAVLVGLVFVLIRSPNLHLERLVPVLALFCLLEESSYGERLVGLDMPCIAGVKVDTAHDVVELAYTVLKQHGLTKLQMGLSLAATGLVIGFVLMRHWDRVRRWVAPWTSSVPLRLCVVAALCCVAAVLLDLKMNSSLTRCLEETLEFNASLLMLFAATKLSGSRSAQSVVEVEETFATRPAECPA